MNPQIKTKWANALRSGEYKQGRSKLKEVVSGTASFCCLGVLCDIYIKETGNAKWEETLRGSAAFISDEIYETAVLPKVVSDWAEIEEPKFYGNVNFPLGNTGAETNAVFANDTLGLSFNEIADIIEGNIPSSIEGKIKIWQNK